MTHAPPHSFLKMGKVWFVTFQTLNPSQLFLVQQLLTAGCLLYWRIAENHQQGTPVQYLYLVMTKPTENHQQGTVPVSCHDVGQLRIISRVQYLYLVMT